MWAEIFNWHGKAPGRARFLWGILVVLLLCGCETVPVTGREQLNLVSSRQLHSMAVDSYSEVLSKHRVVQGTRDARMVKDVGRRIKGAVERFLRDRGRSDRVSGFEWEFNLVMDQNKGGRPIEFLSTHPSDQSRIQDLRKYIEEAMKYYNK